MLRIFQLLTLVLVIAQICGAQGPIVASSYNNRIVMADQQPSLAACLSSGNQTCVAVANYSTTLTSLVTINANFVTLQCHPGATINLAPGGGIIISGSHVTISGCIFSYSSGGSIPAAIDVQGGAKFVRIENNDFTNFAGLSGNCIVVAPDRTATIASPVSFVWVEKNIFESTNTNITDICAYNQVDHLWIEDNWTDFSSAELNGTEAIIVHAQDSNTKPSFVTIANNKGQGGTGNCIEVQALAGNAPTNINVIGNQCQLLNPHTSGAGFSLSTVNTFVYSNNIFNAGGANLGSGNQPLECVNCVNGAITGNVLNLGIQSASTPLGAIAVDTNISGTSNVTVAGNTVTVTYTGPGFMACYYSGISTPGSMNTINYSGNTCDLSGSTGKVAGIYFQCNHPSATCNNSSVAGNVLVGSNAVVDGGIVFERDSGTMQHNIVGVNQVLNFHTPFSQNFNSPTVGFCSGCVDAATEPATFTVLGYQ